MHLKSIGVAAVVFLAVVIPCQRCPAADWPTYQADGQRSGVTTEQLTFPLALRWAYEPCRPPEPAWPEPGKELHRIDFDYACQPVVAGGLIYFGSSADDTVRALDLDTGKTVWRFITGGPVRFAPAIARGKAYIVSDDGCLYCLDAGTGKLVWRFRAASRWDRLVGNGRLIARYPCRSGALVSGNVVYVTAGMWPTEGVYVCALDADTGRELWRNDSSGSVYVDLPHAGASGFSGVAPQGYLAASGDVLLVPTGRSVPAAFDLRTGRLLYYKPEKTHYHGVAYGGGVWCTTYGDLYFHPNNRFQNPSEAHIGEADPCPSDGMIMYTFASGDQQASIPGKYRVLVTGDVVYAAGNGSVDAVDLGVLRTKKRVGTQDAKWTTPHSSRVYCLALAGQTLLTGNRDSIAALDAADGKPVWRVDLEGQQVRGLAVADACLVAATHTGKLLCFGPGRDRADAGKVVREQAGAALIPEEHSTRAADIIRRSGKSEGYALVVGERDSRLAEALARQTQLHVVSVLLGGSQAVAERERLLEAGLLGSRVAVFAVGDSEPLQLPPFFADLVVLSGSVKAITAEESYRSLRPCGGVLCLVGFDTAAAAEVVRSASIPQDEADLSACLVVRGQLPGAGEWRYPWADGGRSGIGKESRVRFPLDLLWFGGPGPGRLVDRHLMGSPPISTNGRVFMQGQNHVIAFDAYNGRELWSRQVQEVGRKYAQYYSSSLVADDDSVYVVQSDRCHRLDQTTGKIVATYTIPEPVVSGTAPAEMPDYVDVEWPETWRVLGPFQGGKPPLSGEGLETIPERVDVAGAEYVPTALAAVGTVLDFTALYGGYDLKPLAPGQSPAKSPRRGKSYSYHDVGRTCYAFATINCPESGKLLIGAGADWGMQWFLDGKLVFDALRGGSGGSRRGYYDRQPCSTEDRFFDVDVSAGEHVLAVMVTAGSRGWALASASVAEHARDLLPIATGANPNVPNLKDLVWGYLSAADGLVLGSYNVPVTAGQPAESHLLWRSESRALFALNKRDGSLRWVYRPQPDRIVSNIEIAFGDGKLFLTDGTSRADLVREKRRKQEVKAEVTLVALSLADGAELWRQDDVPLLGDRSMLSRLKSNITHLFMGLPNWGHLVYADGVVVLGANAAYDAATGRKLWEQNIRPGKLPLIYGDRLITAAHAYDLRTGEQRMTTDELTGREIPWRYRHAYGCGPVAGCENVLFFRSGADGFFDMQTEGTTNFGGVRPGCARTLLAANGLLIHPQGYSGCCCSYNFKTNLALIAGPDRGADWYVFARGEGEGQIKHIAINLGAPGDRKDQRGTAWLGFPRPLVSTARPAPVTAMMADAASYYNRDATATIRGTDSPWLYSSGLRGRGRIAIDLVLQTHLVLPRGAAAPAIDGKLDEACWQNAEMVPFENTPFSMLGASVELRLFRDDENIYFGYHRRPIPNARSDVDRAALGANDELDIFVADPAKRAGVRFVIKRNGNTTAKFGTVEVGRKTDPSWQGEWQCVVTDSEADWVAEVAVPLETLTQSGLSLSRLMLNCMSQNLTQSGLEGVFLTDPRYGTKFRSCIGFRRLVDPPAGEPPERSFSVRLHFAETAHAAAGRRVFDVLLQGQPVLQGFDVLQEAGGRNTAVVRQFAGVRARAQLVVELASSNTSAAAECPVLCAVEVVEEDAK